MSTQDTEQSNIIFHEDVVFHESCYKELLAVGIPEDWAKKMATQPGDCFGHDWEDGFADKGAAVWSFGVWGCTTEGTDYWITIADEFESAFSMPVEQWDALYYAKLG